MQHLENSSAYLAQLLITVGQHFPRFLVMQTINLEFSGLRFVTILLQFLVAFKIRNWLVI